MQNLKQYIELIAQFKAKKEELAILMGGNDTKLYSFCVGILDKQLKTDEEASKHLYKQLPTYPSYKALKTELKKRLIDAILSLDYKQHSLNDVQQVYYTCQKNWAAINVLAGRSKIDAAIDLAQTTLNLALRYEQTEIAVNTSRLLVYFYNLYNPLSRRIGEYEKIYDIQSEILEAEQLSFKYYNEISKNYIRVRDSQKHLHEKAVKYYFELDKYLSLDIKPSFRFFFTTTLIRIIVYTSINNYKKALTVIDEAIGYFDNIPFEVKSQISSLLHQKIACCIQLRLFSEGKAAAARSLSLVTVGTYNWYRDRLLYLQLCLHTGKYQEGWHALFEMLQHRNFNNQNVVIKDEVNIYLSYLKYMVEHGKIKTVRKEKEVLKSFDISGYINIAPSFYKDKQGLNIPALVSQILWLLSEKNYDAVYFRIVALEKYKIRNIIKDKEEGTYRTGLFIKMINKVVKYTYNHRVVEQKTRRDLKELKNTALNINNNALQSEILPHEVTWDLIMATLD